MKFYKIIDAQGYVLSNKEEQSAKMLFGYGGVWCKDHRKAKRFKTIKECQQEVNKMSVRKGTKFLIVSNDENWKKAYKQHLNEFNK